MRQSHVEALRAALRLVDVFDEPDCVSLVEFFRREGARAEGARARPFSIMSVWRAGPRSIVTSCS